MSAPQTFLDKIWAQHVIVPRPGDAELPAFRERDLENFRRVLTDIGMAK